MGACFQNLILGDLLLLQLGNFKSGASIEFCDCSFQDQDASVVNKQLPDQEVHIIASSFVAFASLLSYIFTNVVSSLAYGMLLTLELSQYCELTLHCFYFC